MGNVERMIELFDSYDWGLLPLQDDKEKWNESWNWNNE